MSDDSKVRIAITKAFPTWEEDLLNVHVGGDGAKRANSKVVQRYLRLTVLRHYGTACACCGYADMYKKVFGHSVLEIDHINGVTPEERKKQTPLYWWLVEHDFPEGFRTLCRACNSVMEAGESKCELHKWEKLY